MPYIGKSPTAVPLSASDLDDDIISLAKLASGTDGNLITYDASGNPVAVATGDDGQVLTSAGAGQPCAFEAAAGGGLIKIETKEFSSANATLDFEGCFSSTYDNYFLTGWLQNDNTNWALRGLQGYGATPTWITSSNYYNFTIKGYNPSTFSYDYFSAAAYYDFGFAGGCGDTALGITIDFANFGSGLVGVNEPTLFYRHYGLGGNSYGRTEVTIGAARLNDANQPTSWRFDASAGDFEKGCVTMYGLAK